MSYEPHRHWRVWNGREFVAAERLELSIYPDGEWTLWDISDPDSVHTAAFEENHVLQFWIGAYDAKNKPIFPEDIVAHSRAPFEKLKSKVVWSTDSGHRLHNTLGTALSWAPSLIVIGNTLQHPELLK